MRLESKVQDIILVLLMAVIPIVLFLGLILLGTSLSACTTTQADGDDPNVGWAERVGTIDVGGHDVGMWRWYDQEKHVTCWVLTNGRRDLGGAGISCIPDRILEGGY